MGSATGWSTRMKIRPFLRGPIALRLFIFNCLLLFVPVAGFLSFEAYEKALLNNLEHSLVQEGRALAAWLGEEPLNQERARRIIASLRQRHTSRIRILSNEGMLLADSSALQGRRTTDQTDTASGSINADAAVIVSSNESIEQTPPQETFIYRLLSWPVRIYRKYFLPPSPIQGADYYSGKNYFDGEEIQAALGGRYGSTTRISSGGQTSIILYSALPILRDGDVSGVVLVSQSTFRILNDLYALRFGMGRIFLFSLLIAVVVSLIMALTISRPLSRLTKEAKQFRITKGVTKIPAETEQKIFSGGWRTRKKTQKRQLQNSSFVIAPAKKCMFRSHSARNCKSLGKTNRVLQETQESSSNHFSGSNRYDEIDTLAAAFSDLVEKLEQRVSWAERFSADAAHELKNPLAGIRANAELLETDDPVQQGLIASIENACERMEKTINGLRTLTLLEGSNGTTPIEQFGNVISEEAQHYHSPPVIFENLTGAVPRYSSMTVHVPVQNLETAVRNLFKNAHSFSPEDEPVKAELRINGERLELHVTDTGPGIPQELREKIFERFYTSRRGSRSEEHSGLGLAIVKAIAESGGGSVSVKDSGGHSGAHFIISLPYSVVT